LQVAVAPTILISPLLSFTQLWMTSLVTGPTWAAVIDATATLTTSTADTTMPRCRQVLGMVRFTLSSFSAGSLRVLA
jgi:hypothetical protein